MISRIVANAELLSKVGARGYWAEQDECGNVL